MNSVNPGMIEAARLDGAEGWRLFVKIVLPHSSLGNQTPAEARRALEPSEGSAPGALAQPKTDQYQPQGLSL